MPADATILLTRPRAAAEAFAAELRAAGAGRIVISPAFEIEDLPQDTLPDAPGGVILTSARAVAAARVLNPGTRAFCVGDRTAAAARDAGLAAESAGRDAEALVEMILAIRPEGVLLHLRGEEVRGDIAARLSAAGLPCVERVVYRKVECPLTDEARTLLDGEAPVVLPLFSPRTAQLVSEAVPIRAPLRIAAMSPAVAAAARSLVPEVLRIADAPDREAMLTLTLGLLA